MAILPEVHDSHRRPLHSRCMLDAQSVSICAIGTAIINCGHGFLFEIDSERTVSENDPGLKVQHPPVLRRPRSPRTGPSFLFGRGLGERSFEGPLPGGPELSTGGAMLWRRRLRHSLQSLMTSHLNGDGGAQMYPAIHWPPIGCLVV
jgi:hypothetical protein